MQLDGQRLIQELPENQEYDTFILDCYDRLLASNDESIRTAASDYLFGYYLRREEYEKAETYLPFFSTQNPEQKRKQAFLHEKSGDWKKAFQPYEESLLADYQIHYMHTCPLRKLILHSTKWLGTICWTLATQMAALLICRMTPDGKTPVQVLRNANHLLDTFGYITSVAPNRNHS